MISAQRSITSGTLIALSILGAIGCGGGGSADTSLAAPGSLVAMPFDTQKVQLSWIDNATAEDGFRIYRDDGSGFVELTTVPADWMGYQDLTVVDGQWYDYYVVAYAGATEGPASNIATVEAGPPYVTILTPNGGENLTLGAMYNITWVTNLPDFDARILLSTDNGVTWPPQHIIQYSWAPNGSPYPWKVGYINTESNPALPPVWQQVVMTTNTECKIFIRHYAAVGAQDWSDLKFTITVP